MEPVGLGEETVVYHRCGECKSKTLVPCRRIYFEEEEESYYTCKECIDAEFSVFSGKYQTLAQWNDANEKEKEKQRLDREASDIIDSERQLKEQLMYANNNVKAFKDTVSKIKKQLDEVKEKKRKFDTAVVVEAPKPQ